MTPGSGLAKKLDATPGWRRIWADKTAVVQARDGIDRPRPARRPGARARRGPLKARRPLSRVTGDQLSPARPLTMTAPCRRRRPGSASRPRETAASRAGLESRRAAWQLAFGRQGATPGEGVGGGHAEQPEGEAGGERPANVAACETCRIALGGNPHRHVAPRLHLLSVQKGGRDPDQIGPGVDRRRDPPQHGLHGDRPRPVRWR